MGYSKDDRMVRVDFFRESGKWYTTEDMIWDRYSNKDSDGKGIELVDETFKRCLNEQFPGQFIGMIAICLEPYHEHAFPQMVRR